MFSDGLQNMDAPVLANRQGITYISLVWTLDAV